MFECFLFWYIPELVTSEDSFTCVRMCYVNLAAIYAARFFCFNLVWCMTEKFNQATNKPFGGCSLWCSMSSLIQYQ